MAMTIMHKWKLCDDFERAAVPGGWLYRPVNFPEGLVFVPVTYEEQDKRSEEARTTRLAGTPTRKNSMSSPRRSGSGIDSFI